MVARIRVGVVSWALRVGLIQIGGQPWWGSFAWVFSRGVEEQSQTVRVSLIFLGMYNDICSPTPEQLKDQICLFRPGRRGGAWRGYSLPHDASLRASVGPARSRAAVDTLIAGFSLPAYTRQGAA